MKNIRGEFGVINRTGKLGDSSHLEDCRSEGFYENIEEQILSTVKALIEKNMLTVSSCQGHPGKYCNRCVSIIGEISEVIKLAKFISDINEQYKWELPILIEFLQVQPSMNLYNGMFCNPLILQILFGDYADVATQIKQSIFNEEFSNTYPLQKQDETPLLNFKDYECYMFKGSHQDDFL